MARILPDRPVVNTTPEALKIYHLLKRLPGAYQVWQRLDVVVQEGPDFWVLDGEKRALLLKVACTTPEEARAAVQPQLFAREETPVPGRVETTQLLRFRERLGEPDLPAAVLFPNVGRAALAPVREAKQAEAVWWAGKETLTPAGFETWLGRRLSAPLGEEAVARLRAIFSPEVRVAAALTVRRQPVRDTEAGLTEYLLDYRQEELLKSDLDLSADAQSTAQAFGLRLVNGVAGSGKSLIVIYRALLLRRLYPRKRILVLTHNRPLIRDLESRYLLLSDGDRTVRWRTFLSWCRQQWPQHLPEPEVVRYRERRELVRRAWHRHLADSSISPEQLQGEIDWVKDRFLFGREAYLSADRGGRGFGLQASTRERVYEAMEAYHAELRSRGLVDWADLPRALWRWVEEGSLRLPVYDAVLVDEAQFFAPVWFELIKRIVKPRTGHLFLAADPSQGFLKRGQSWVASGLEVRGRAHRLEKSYRTTREILTFGTLLYRRRLKDDDEEIVAPDLLNMPDGTLPVIVPVSTPQDELTRVVNEIEQLVAAGVPPGHILVIHADWRRTGNLVGRLNGLLGEGAAVDPGKVAGGEQIRVTSLNAATGLESPIVFLMGVHTLYEEEQSVRLAEEERAELIRDNTRRLYMAITRAGQRLVLTYVGELPASLVELAAEAVVAPAGNQNSEGGFFSVVPAS